MEGNLAVGASSGIDDFRWLLASATLATVAGALLIPTAQRVLARWVEAIGDRPSPFALLRRMASPATLAHIREAVVLPSRIAGTMLAQVLLVPSAMWIVTVAEWL